MPLTGIGAQDVTEGKKDALEFMDRYGKERLQQCVVHLAKEVIPFFFQTVAATLSNPSEASGDNR